MTFNASATQDRMPEGVGEPRARAPVTGNRCRFCRERIREIDYKTVYVLSKMLSAQGKMHSRRRSGCCSFHQRSLKRAVRRARFLALLLYTG